MLQQEEFAVTGARRSVAMTFRSRRPTNHDIAEDVKLVGGMLDIEPGVHVYETTVALSAGQTVEYGLFGLPAPQIDAVGKGGAYRYPPFPNDGQSGVAFQWLEIEGPLPPASWPPPSHRVLFDNLGITPSPAQPKQEATRLLRRFAQMAGRGPVNEVALRRFEQLVHSRLDRQEPFVEAMLTGYGAGNATSSSTSLILGRVGGSPIAPGRSALLPPVFGNSRLVKVGLLSAMVSLRIWWEAFRSLAATSGSQVRS